MQSSVEVESNSSSDSCQSSAFGTTFAAWQVATVAFLLRCNGVVKVFCTQMETHVEPGYSTDLVDKTCKPGGVDKSSVGYMMTFTLLFKTSGNFK